MLSELPNVRQIPGEGRRRWFTNGYFDLIVWYDGDDPVGFQLCYDKQHQERALTWRRPSSFTHTRVDDGEGAFGPKRTPVLVQNGVFDAVAITERFREASAGIQPEVAKMVIAALERYAPPSSPADSPPR